MEDPKSLIFTSSIGPPNRHFFKYYKTITINHNQVNGTGDHKNFPVLISLLDSDLKDHVNQSNGNDIAFANDTAWLDHEIEIFDQTYNGTHAKLIAWVRIPNLHTTKFTEIDMYYGNSTMGSQENPENVWDTNFKGVWHLSEDPSGSPPQMKDSTSNHNHGTVNRVDTDDQVDGQIDGSIDFDNDQDYINCTDDPSLNVGSGEFSLSLWFNYDGGDDGFIAGKGAYFGGIRYDIEISELDRLKGEIDDGDVQKTIETSYTVNDNTWHHVVLVRDENFLLLYIDGYEYTFFPIPGYGSLDNELPFYINTLAGDNSGQISDYTTAKLDEVRVSTSARSADWIATEYNNQYDPSSFYSISKQYKVIKHPVNAHYFRYYKEITIDNTMVNSSTDLLNFSILISIFDSDLRDHVYSSNGNDIAFAFNAMWLDHEIELFDQTYNDTHSQLISWVCIPILSTSLDTIIYMYYGNSTMGSRENPEGVWDSNYKGVWHLSELSGGTDSIKDSTLNGNNGTDYGTPSFGATGKMDGAIDLKGDIEDEYIEIPNSPSLTNITNGSYYTYEAWFYPDQIPPGIPNDHNNRRYGIMIKKDPHQGLYYDHDQYFAMEHWLDVGGTPTAKKVLSGTYTPGEFYHLVVVVSNIDGYMKLYVNGNLENETTWASGTDAWDYGTKFLRFGIANPGASIYRWPADGKIDEIRVSNTFRSAGWIKTEYNNQYNPQSFMTLGLEEELKIVDETPPTYSDLIESSDPLRVGQNVTISIKVYDFPGSGVNQVLLEYDSSNHTMVFIGGNTWSWNKWKPSIGIHFYKIFMEDMANNWNMTSGTITVVEATAPIIENVTKSEDPIELGNNVTISVDVFDNETSVSTVFIELEAKNYTMVNVNADTYEYNWTSSHTGIVYYTIYACDSVNNWGFINDSILVQDTTPPFYSNLFESADPLELGDSPIISVDIFDFAGINQTFIEIEGVNYSMTNDGNTWEYDSWTPNNWIVYQYKIHTEDNNGNWNSLITNITVEDTTPPSQPLLASNPSGDVSGILVFDWLDGFDHSGIAYYILIIDNETNPLTTPGYVYIFNITNTGAESSYCELPEILPPGKYYFFLAQVDGVGQQSDYTVGTFTVISISGNNIFLIIVIGLVSIIGSITAIVLIRKKLKKDITPIRYKIPFKIISSHINKLASPQFAVQAKKDQSITDEKEIKNRINEIKSLAEELFAEGAYLEAQKQFKLGRDLLISLGKKEEAKLFSELISGIAGLIEEREKRIEILEQIKLEGNSTQVFELYHEIIVISKKLRDSDSASFYQSDLIQFFRINDFKLIDLTEYRSVLEQEADSLMNNNQFEIAAQIYSKCQIISQIFIQLDRDDEIPNFEKFGNKEAECLKRIKEKKI